MDHGRIVRVFYAKHARWQLDILDRQLFCWIIHVRLRER